jgi:NADH dehydrogenase [ubiquinone] 1 alpha subcomplex assembly factor 6
MTDEDLLSYCAKQVRDGDNDRFLTALFAPAPRREGLFALYAFNLEVARIAEAVHEPMMGQIRLQWWRERIAEIYRGEAPKGAEVPQALSEAIRALALPQAPFDALLNAREDDLVPDAPATLSEFEGYAAATGGELMSLALHALDANDETTQHAGRHVGIATAIVGHLRAAAFHARSLGEGGEEDLRAGRPSAALTAAAEQVAAKAEDHLRVARSLAPQVSKLAWPALLQARLADAYLARLERARFDLFSPSLEIAKPRRQMIIAWAAWRSRF